MPLSAVTGFHQGDDVVPDNLDIGGALLEAALQ